MQSMKPTFLYHAQASVLGGFITKPGQKVVETVAGVSLPFTGGHQREQVNGYCYDTPRITIASATAEVSGSQDGNGVYNTTISTSINGLVIQDIETSENIITADCIEMSIATHHNGGNSEATVKIDGNFKNLVVKGAPVNYVLDTSLNNAQTYAQFDQQYGNNQNVSHSNRKGKMRCSLIKQLTHPNANTATDQQSLYVPNFGTIYLGEVYLADSTRQVNMVRLELGSPVAGTLALGGGSGNGSTFP
jgi:hypothetical protein